jgi:hypothetical protein
VRRALHPSLPPGLSQPAAGQPRWILAQHPGAGTHELTESSATSGSWGWRRRMARWLDRCRVSGEAFSVIAACLTTAVQPNGKLSPRGRPSGGMINTSNLSVEPDQAHARSTTGKIGRFRCRSIQRPRSQRRCSDQASARTERPDRDHGALEPIGVAETVPPIAEVRTRALSEGFVPIHSVSDASVTLSLRCWWSVHRRSNPTRSVRRVLRRTVHPVDLVRDMDAPPFRDLVPW